MIQVTCVNNTTCPQIQKKTSLLCLHLRFLQRLAPSFEYISNTLQLISTLCWTIVALLIIMMTMRVHLLINTMQKYNWMPNVHYVQCSKEHKVKDVKIIMVSIYSVLKIVPLLCLRHIHIQLDIILHYFMFVCLFTLQPNISPPEPIGRC